MAVGFGTEPLHDGLVPDYLILGVPRRVPRPDRWSSVPQRQAPVQDGKDPSPSSMQRDASRPELWGSKEQRATQASHCPSPFSRPFAYETLITLDK